MATKKKAAPKKGIVLTKGKTGIIVNIYAGNSRHLFRATGYNNAANVQKGLAALYGEVMQAYARGINDKFEVTDLTKPAPKKSAPKKKA